MLLLFGFYNVRDDVSPGDYADAERSIAERYRAGCRTFGWESLGTYACRPGRRWPFGHVHPYVIEGSDTAAAMRAAEQAPGPPGFAEVVEIGQSFLTGQDDTAVARLRDAGAQPSAPVPLGDRAIVVDFAATVTSRHSGHAGWLGWFGVDGVAGAENAEVCIHDSADGTHGWTLTPIVPGAEAIVPVS